MNNGQQLHPEVKGIVADANSQLDTLDSAPFSPTAFSLLREKIAEYISSLLTESNKVARRHQADTISANHVQRATEYLVAITSRRVFRHLGTLGGIFLGAALSNIVMMTGSDQFTTAGVLLSAALGMVGAFMVALHIVKE